MVYTSSLLSCCFSLLQKTHFAKNLILNIEIVLRRLIRISHIHHIGQNFFHKTPKGIEKYGLTPFGTLVVDRMSHLSMILDVAHASEHLLDGEGFIDLKR